MLKKLLDKNIIGLISILLEIFALYLLVSIDSKYDAFTSLYNISDFARLIIIPIFTIPTLIVGKRASDQKDLNKILQFFVVIGNLVGVFCLFGFLFYLGFLGMK